jgi:hypothetical protein
LVPICCEYILTIAVTILAFLLDRAAVQE